MTTFILVAIMLHTQFSKADSVSSITVPGFTSQQECEAAGNRLKSTQFLEVSAFQCLQQTK